MTVDFVACFGEALRGRACIITRRENDWLFDFGGGCVLSTATPWRIVDHEGIAFADTDDGQIFGLPHPVEGEAKSNASVRGLKVVAVEVDDLTADIRVHFSDRARLELFNNSCGYEGWQANFPLDGRLASIIALGGGGLAYFER